jgi:aminomethyltransferase
MTTDSYKNGFRIDVVATPDPNANPSELEHTMAQHPLIHHELPYSPRFGIYNRRLMTLSMNNADDNEAYWMCRRSVVMRHTGELATEVRGPDAECLLNLVFTRDVSKTKVGRCSYQVACYHDGGMITDGVLVRLAEDRFWYGQGEGDFYSWLKSYEKGLDAEVLDPNVWISQVQGPRSLEVLAAAVDGDMPDPFKYFDCAETTIAGQKVVLTRTGFTNELGWEYYVMPDIDAKVLGDRILEAGKPFGMMPVAAYGFRARRIEAGLFNAISDFDETVTPYAAGLGHMVDLDKPDFAGKGSLVNADKRRRTWGLKCEGGVSRIGFDVATVNGKSAGKVCSSAWSPYLQCGVALVRLDDADLGPGAEITVACVDGNTRKAVVSDTPLYDKERKIPRGEATDIPEMRQ